ncbi:unnamed protein product, partial [Ectocarpus sp. 13 AM-2016]
PVQPASFSLVQVRIPTRPAESGTSRLLLSAGVPHPSDKQLRELPVVYGIVAANVKASCLKAQPPPPPPPPSAGDGADIGLSGARHRLDGLPQSFAPPSVEVASDSVKVAQLWGLHDNVQAALDRLVVGPDKNADREQISLRLGQRNLEQLASTGWIRTVKRRGAKVELYQQSGTIRVTRLCVIAASLAEALPRSVQLVDMVDAAVMRNVAAPANLDAFARAGGSVAGDIEVIPVWESWRVLVVAPGEGAAEGTVDRVCKAISQAARRWADAHVSVPLNPQMYVKQLHKGRWQRGVEKDSKPPIIADLSRAVSKYGVDLWLDAFCLRAHVGEIAVKKAVEAVLRTKLKQKYPGLLAKRRAADAPSSTVDGAGPADLASPKSRASAWGSGNFRNSAIAAGGCPATGGLFGAPAPAGAGPKILTPTSVELPAGTGDGAAGASPAAAPSYAAAAVGTAATATAGRVRGGRRGGDGAGAGDVPSFSFGTADRPPSRPPSSVWGSGRISSSGTATTTSTTTASASGGPAPAPAPAPAAAAPKKLAPSSSELPAGKRDGAAAAVVSTMTATPAAAAAAVAAAAATAGHVRRSSDGDGDEDGAVASTASLSVASASTASVAPAAAPAGHVGVGRGSCAGGIGAFPTFSFGTEASGPPTRAWDMESFGNFAIAAGSSPATRGVFGAPVPAGAGPKMLTPTSVELPAGTGDGVAGTSSAVAPAVKVVSDCDDAVVGEQGTP